LDHDVLVFPVEVEVEDADPHEADDRELRGITRISDLAVERNRARLSNNFGKCALHTNAEARFTVEINGLRNRIEL
jgi:hypothetical protein